MTDMNYQNMIYFEDASMKGLYAQIRDWQEEHKKRLLSISIQVDRGMFCCIALTNPVLVTIVDAKQTSAVNVESGLLWVDSARTTYW